MDHSGLVGGAQGAADLLADVQRRRLLQRRVRLGDEVEQVLPLEALHHVVGGAVRERAEVDDLDDVLAPDRGGGLGLALEAKQQALVHLPLGAEGLHGEGPAGLDLGDRVDDAHAAAPEHAVDPVAVLDHAPDPGVLAEALPGEDGPGHRGLAGGGLPRPAGLAAALVALRLRIRGVDALRIPSGDVRRRPLPPNFLRGAAPRPMIHRSPAHACPRFPLCAQEAPVGAPPRRRPRRARRRGVERPGEGAGGGGWGRGRDRHRGRVRDRDRGRDRIRFRFRFRRRRVRRLGERRSRSPRRALQPRALPGDPTGARGAAAQLRAGRPALLPRGLRPADRARAGEPLRAGADRAAGGAPLRRGADEQRHLPAGAQSVLLHGRHPDHPAPGGAARIGLGALRLGRPRRRHPGLPAGLLHRPRERGPAPPPSDLRGLLLDGHGRRRARRGPAPDRRETTRSGWARATAASIGSRPPGWWPTRGAFPPWCPASRATAARRWARAFRRPPSTCASSTPSPGISA